MKFAVATVLLAAVATAAPLPADAAADSTQDVNRGPGGGRGYGGGRSSWGGGRGYGGGRGGWGGYGGESFLNINFV